MEALVPHLAGAELQVDANGGWDLETAKFMLPWLFDRGVVLVEQPLPARSGDEQDFAALHGLSPIAIVADESCWGIEDMLRLAPYCARGEFEITQNRRINRSLFDGSVGATSQFKFDAWLLFR